MIRPLRAWHRVMIPVIGAIVGAVMLWGLGARRAAPVVETLPVAFAAAGVYGTLAPDSEGHPALRLERSDDGGRSLSLYWVATAPRHPDRLPERAFWVGQAAEGTSYRLPDAASGGKGTLLLYDLARSEIVDRAVLR